MKTLSGLKKFESEFFIGFLLGAFYLPSSQLLSIAGSYLPFDLLSVTFFFYPVCMSVFGMGLVWGEWRKRPVAFAPASFTIIAAIGALIGISVFLPSSVTHSGPIFFGTLALLALIGVVYFAFGVQFSATLQVAGKRFEQSVGSKLFFQALGYAFSIAVVSAWGPDAILAFVASLAILRHAPAKIRYALIVIALFLPWRGLSTHVEMAKMRHFQATVEAEQGATALTPGLGKHVQWKVVLMRYWDCSRVRPRWSFRGIFNVCSFKSYPDFRVAFFNLGPAFEYGYPNNDHSLRRFREQLYGSIAKGDRVALIGVGGGRTVDLLNAAELGPQVYAVERDPSAFAYSLEQGGTRLKQIHYLNYEGRSFLEKAKKPFDWIIFESSIDQAWPHYMSIFTPFFLNTREALKTTLSKLSSRGVIVFEVSRLTTRMRLGLFESVKNFFERQRNGSFHMRVVYDARKGRLLDSGYILASRDESRLNDILKDAPYLKTSPTASGINPESLSKTCRGVLSDSKPFLVWNCMPEKRIFWPTLVFLLVLSLALLSLLVYKTGHTSFILRFSAFTLFGPLFFIANVYLLRSYFQDNIVSFYILTILFYLVFGIVGLLYPFAERVFIALARRWWIVLIVMVFHWMILRNLPFASGLPERVIYFTLGFLPAIGLIAIYYNLMLVESVSQVKMAIQRTLAFEVGLMIMSYAVLAMSLLYLGTGATFWAAAALLLPVVLFYRSL